MTESIREQIISAIESKLSKIRIKYGFNTECGLNVFRGLPIPVHSDYMPASSIMPGLDSNENVGGREKRLMQIRVQALKIFDTENPSVTSEKVFADLQECIQGNIWMIEFYSGGTHIPIGGESVLGETSEAVAIIENVTLNSGTWAAGDAAGILALRRLQGSFSDGEELTIDSNAGAMTVNGYATGYNAVKTTTNELAELIEFVSGGLDSYPEHDENIVGASIIYNIEYKILTGNPYSQ